MINILYNREIDLNFSLYGVEIPIVNDRALKVFEKLNDDKNEFKEVDTSEIPLINKSDLELVHDKKYVDDLFSSYHSLEFHMLKSYELVDDNGNFNRYNPNNAKENFSHALKIILKQVGLTYLAANKALENNFCYFLGGGMHHAMTSTGRGFCLVNDIAITIRKLQREGKIKRAWVIDVDAHKGDGTAEVFKHDLFVTTLSIHMKEGWPLNSGTVRDPWFIPSHVDIGIDVNEEERYLEKLEMGLLELQTKYPAPDLCIVVNGADPYELDELESAKLLKLSKVQMLKRDQLVFNFLKDLKIPQAYVMAGGYGHHSWEVYYQFLKFVRESSS